MNITPNSRATRPAPGLPPRSPDDTIGFDVISEGDLDAERERRRHRDEFRDDESVAQAWALGQESRNLRDQAERCAGVLERGGSVDREQVGAVLRAFRAYRPFVFDRDRALNDAARKRLARAAAGDDPRLRTATA